MPWWVSPREASLLITGRCNLRCRHCSVTSHGALSDGLSLNKWENILDELQRSKILKLTITGGEPMARTDFTQFIRAVRKRPFRFAVNTNATLLTPAIVEAVKDCSSRLNEFMISLDGPDAETVDSQRGEGVFEKMVLGVKMLKMAKIPFGFYCTVTSLNIHKLAETANFAMSLGGNWIKFNHFVLAGPGLQKEMIPMKKAVYLAASELEQMSLKHPGFIQGTILDMQARARDYLAGKLEKQPGRAYACGGGRAKVSIFPDGSVTPCDHLPEFVLGNITEKSLQEILTGSKMDEFTSFLNRKRSENPECSECTLLNYCTGGCPVEALNLDEGIGKDRLSCLKLALQGL